MGGRFPGYGPGPDDELAAGGRGTWDYGADPADDPNRCGRCGQDDGAHCSECSGCWDHAGWCSLDPANIEHERDQARRGGW